MCHIAQQHELAMDQVLWNDFIAYNIIQGFCLANDMGYALQVDHHHIGPEGNKLKPLCIIIGTNPLNNKVIAFFHQWKQQVVPKHVNVHTQGTING